MLTNMQIAVIGGDARQLEIIRKLTELDAKLYLIGFEQLDHAFQEPRKEKRTEINFSQMDAIILPDDGTSLEGRVNSIFSNEKGVLLEEMLRNTPPHCVIFSGTTNAYLTGITDGAKRKLVQLFNRDDEPYTTRSLQWKERV